jgi:hypothetical protein
MDLYSTPDNIQDLMDYTVVDAPSRMDVRSDTIDPLNSSAFNYRFRLEPTSVLGRDSLLLFKLQSTVGGDEIRASLMAGGLAGIKTARLSVGDQIVEEVRDFDKVKFHDFVSTRDRSELSRFHSRYWGCDFRSAPSQTSASGVGALETATTGQIVMSDKCGTYFGAPANYANAVVRNQSVTTAAANNYQIGIRLGRLFECINSQNFPVFLFDQYRIYIDIEFHDASHFVNDISTVRNAHPAVQSAQDGTISFQDVKLQVDYHILPTEMLDRIRQSTLQEGGLRLEYPVYKVIEKTLTAPGLGTQQSADLRLGLSDLEVHEITMCKQYTGVTADGATFPGRNRSLMLGLASDGAAQEEYNVTVNGEDQFPFFYSSKSSQHHLQELATGKEVRMERSFYYTDQNDLDSGLTTIGSGLQGTYSTLGISLRNGNPIVVGGGQMIGAYPVVFRYKRTPVAHSANNGTQNAAMDVKFLCKVSGQTVVQSTVKGMEVVTM